MDIEIKIPSYSEIDVVYKNNYSAILQNNKKDVSLIEEVIEYSSHLSNIMRGDIYEEYKKSGKEVNGPKGLIPILWDRNNRYIIASYKSAMFGLINPSRSLMRTVFETITQIYLLHLTEREADLYFKNQLDILTPIEKKEFKCMYNYLGPSVVRNILYVNKKKETLDKFYSEISNSAHASIKSALAEIELNEKIIKDTLGGILMLGFANIIAFNEIYSGKYDGKTIELINKFIEKVFKERGDEVIDIVPNNPSFLKKLNYAYKP